MFLASELTLYYRIWGLNTYQSHIYADCNHCNTNQPAEKNDHFMHTRYIAWQTLQGSRHMFSASELTLYYHIQWAKTFWSPIYAYCNHCNASQPAGTMTILCMLTILLGKHCRGHAECSWPRTRDPTLYSHIRWPNTFGTHIYAYFSQCNHNIRKTQFDLIPLGRLNMDIRWLRWSRRHFLLI